MLHPAQLLERVHLRGVAERLRALRWGLHEIRPLLEPRIAWRLTTFWVGDLFWRRRYPTLSESQLQRTRRAETVFVFGSGRSLVDISDEEWERIAQFDTIGFSNFHYERWVRVDYHLVMELLSASETVASIQANPNYANTVFGLMEGWIAEASNELVARRLLPVRTRVFRWRRIARGRFAPPTRSLADGLVHGTNSLHDVVNFALLMGWQRIVIAGVDLYNKEYFWLPAGEIREGERPGFVANSRWSQADAMIEMFRHWREIAEHEGIELLVYNPRSLLAEALPVFSWPNADELV